MYKRYQRRAPLRALLSVSLAGVLSFSLFLAPYASAATENDKHLVTIHDRGEEKSILTTDSTLRQVFHDAGIVLDQNDMVEPGLDKELIGQSYQVNVYRARPIVIVDGARQTKIMSAYQTPKQIAQHAGITLHDEDETTLSLAHDLITNGASLRMTIDRAVPVELVLYGEETTMYTQAETVESFLQDKQITLGERDTLSVKPAAAITPHMKIEIWRNGKQTVTRHESIPFKVQEIKDTDRPVGYHKITTPGVKGKQLVTYEITMKNGEEIKKKKIETVVTKKPVKQVVVVGTKLNLPAGSHEDWMRQGGISAGDFGYANAIFAQESGWNPAARNPAGYVGLGQTSEANLSSACPSWQTDPICQIRFFDGYAVSRYGSWQNAYTFKFGADGQGGHGWW